MIETRVLFALIPAMFAIFALSLAVIAIIDRRLTAARWGAVAFGLAGLGVLLDSLRRPGISWGLFYLHIGVVWAFAKALAARHRDTLPVGFVITLIATALAVGAMKATGAALETRQLTFNLGLGLALVLMTYRCWEWGHKRLVDRFIFATVAALALTYALKIGYLFANPLSDALSQRPSFFTIGANLVFHFIMGLSGLMAGILLLAVLGVDLIRTQTGKLMTDQLTGLGNRHALDAMISADRSGEWRCGGVLVLDLDHFKLVNDQHGHGCGDRLLAATGAALTRMVGSAGQLFRTGGEEFLLLVDAAHAADLGAIAERAREAVFGVRCSWHAKTIHATASVGYCLRRDGEPIADMIEKADRAMYSAKAAGRNCIRDFRVDDQGGEGRLATA